MDSVQKLYFDALVIGGGIAGLQAALDLADQDFKVAVVERDTSIGGKMIRLSKVFPTLDCSSCITTPKMAAAAHHDNITIFTYCKLNSLDRNGKDLTASVTQHPRYVDPDNCIGCRQCEYSCPIYVADEEEGGFSARKAIYIPFSNAIPQIASMDVENCILCGKCQKVCPTAAIDYFQKPEDFIISAKTAILATGFELTPLENKQQYGSGKIPNVITSLQAERLLAPMVRTTGFCDRQTVWNPIPLPIFNVPVPGTKAWGFPTVLAFVACMPLNRPCCCPAPCRWWILPFIIWTFVLLEKDTNNFIRMPRPWALNSSKARSPQSMKAKMGVLHYTMKISTGAVS